MLLTRHHIQGLKSRWHHWYDNVSTESLTLWDLMSPQQTSCRVQKMSLRHRARSWSYHVAWCHHCPVIHMMPLWHHSRLFTWHYSTSFSKSSVRSGSSWSFTGMQSAELSGGLISQLWGCGWGEVIGEIPFSLASCCCCWSSSNCRRSFSKDKLRWFWNHSTQHIQWASLQYCIFPRWQHYCWWFCLWELCHADLTHQCRVTSAWQVLLSLMW